MWKLICFTINFLYRLIMKDNLYVTLTLKHNYIFFCISNQSLIWLNKRKKYILAHFLTFEIIILIFSIRERKPIYASLLIFELCTVALEKYFIYLFVFWNPNLIHVHMYVCTIYGLKREISKFLLLILH